MAVGVVRRATVATSAAPMSNAECLNVARLRAGAVGAMAPWRSIGRSWSGLAWFTCWHWSRRSFSVGKACLSCAVLMIVTGAMGVCMGYHRCLTHGSFKTYRPVRWLLAFLGGLSGEGSALTWVANHRKHHHFSDKEGDPHSPRDGAWWSHMLWFMPNFGRRWHKELVEKYAPDIMKDKMMVVHSPSVFAVAHRDWASFCS